MDEYRYNYSFDFDISNIKNFQLRRKFEIITKIEQQSDEMKIPIKFMKISSDLNYIIVINKKENIFILDWKEDIIENKDINEKSDSIMNKEIKEKFICQICKKAYEKNHEEVNNNIKEFKNQENKDSRKPSEFEIVDKEELIDKIIEDNYTSEDKNICLNCKKSLENYLYSF